MASITLKNGRKIGDGYPPYIIAEFNTSHNGNVNTAKEMVDSAKECGCDCVKFQSWSAETLYSKTYYDQNPISKRVIKKFAFSQDSLKELSEYCKIVGIDFASTPYSRQEVDTLVDFGVPFVKISSMEINNIPYLKYIGDTKMPIIMSTGMSSSEEIAEAVEAMICTGNKNLCLLHCVSTYPADIATVNLRNLKGLQIQYPDIPVGFSDHTLSTEISVAAVALGAAVIEKHFTLDNTKIGMDNQMALEPPEMKSLVTGCRNVHTALGSKERVVTKAELDQRVKMRRSLIAIRDLPSGTVISESDLDTKRPGTGIPPSEIKSVVGKTVKNSINADEIISADNIY